MLHGFDLGGRKIAALQTFAINSFGDCRLPRCHHVRRDVSVDGGVHAKKRVRANTTELMHTGESAADHPVPEMHMTGQCRVVRHDRVVAEHTIMRNVAVGHDPVIVTDNRLALVLRGATADGAKLTNGISVADNQAGRFVCVFLVLRIVTDRCELIDVVVLAYLRRAVDNNVTVDTSTAVYFNTVANYRIWTNLDVVGDLCRV